MALFLTGKVRKPSLLAVGRKRTEMLLIAVLGVESMFGVTVCFSVITNRTECNLTE